MRRLIAPLLMLIALAVGLYRSGPVPQAFAQAPTATATVPSPADLLPGAIELITTAVVASSETALVATPTESATPTSVTTPTPGGETSPTPARRATTTRGADETPEPEPSRTIEPTAPGTATSAPLPTAITPLEIPEENNSPSGTTLVLLAGAGLIVVFGGILARRR